MDKAHLPSAGEYAAEHARFRPLEIVDVQTLQREVHEPYRNQVLLDVNGECLRLAVFEGQYLWHFHPDSDELFLVVEGELRIEFDDGPEAVLKPWQCLIVPAGKVRRTRAIGRTVNVTFERQGAQPVFVDSPAERSREPQRPDGWDGAEE